MGEHQPREPIHAGPVQILAHDALVIAFASAIDQPIVAIHSDVNGRARAQVQHRHLCRDPVAPIRFANIEVSAGNLREQMNDADDQRGQCPVGIIENNSDPREERRSDQRQKRNGEDKECDRNNDEVCQKRNRCDEVEIPKNQRQ